MNISSIRPRLLGSSVLLAAAIALGATVPALAADTVTTTVDAGTQTASIANLALGTSGHLTYSHGAQTPTGSMTLTADDSTGTGAGWNVTVQASDFVFSVGTHGTDIPAANFALTSAALPTMTAGQIVDVTGGPNAATTSGTLEVARKVIAANATFGKGTYTQALGVSLLVPADSASGLYTGTLTTTLASGPA
jgi:hypothetical protein